ncbi:MAG: hypothetical protein M0Z68_06865, partial [Gammaproteobacteria bacterium]|nr:hypothetical protein [Gammaproteobacteria bacterium]
ISFAGENDERAGVLAREREIAEWARREQASRAALALAERARDGARAELEALEGQRAEARRALDRCADVRTKAHGAVQRAHAEEQSRAARHNRLLAELNEIKKELDACLVERERAEDEERRAREVAAQSEAALAALAAQRETHQAALEAARATLRAAADKRHQLAMAQQQARTARDGLRERLARARAELSRLGARRETVARQIEEALTKEREPQAELARLLLERAAVQTALAAAE